MRKARETGSTQQPKSTVMTEAGSNVASTTELGTDTTVAPQRPIDGGRDDQPAG